MAEYAIIRTSILGSASAPVRKGSCTRTLKMAEGDSLFQLAEAIISAYDFELDHAFGFYDNLEDHYESTSVHTSFADFIDGNDPDHGKSVEKTSIGEVFSAGVERLFLFDYGDDWFFHLRCSEAGVKGKPRQMPELIASKGTAPEQYPDDDEEEEEDDA